MCERTVSDLGIHMWGPIGLQMWDLCHLTLISFLFMDFPLFSNVILWVVNDYNDTGKMSKFHRIFQSHATIK